MTLRSRIFVVLSLIVFVILAVSILIAALSKKPGEGQRTGEESNRVLDFFSRGNRENNNQSDPTPSSTAARRQARVPSAQELGENTVKQMAKIFIERYSTFSTDNNFDNIREVESLVTDELWTKISRRMSETRISAAFNGVTTKVITTESVEVADSTAEVNLKVMRIEDKAGAVSTSYSDAKVRLTKSAGEWRVGSFEMK